MSQAFDSGSISGRQEPPVDPAGSNQSEHQAGGPIQYSDPKTIDHAPSGGTTCKSAAEPYLAHGPDVEARFPSLLNEFPKLIASSSIIKGDLESGCRVTKNGQLLLMSRRQLVNELPGFKFLNINTGEVEGRDSILNACKGGTSQYADWALYISPNHRDLAYTLAAEVGKELATRNPLLGRIEEFFECKLRPFNRLNSLHPAIRQIIFVAVALSGWITSCFEERSPEHPSAKPESTNQDLTTLSGKVEALTDEISALREEISRVNPLEPVGDHSDK